MSLDEPAIDYLWRRCHSAPGYLIDGGAGEGTPEYGSMSYRLLHEAGWSGIVIDPVAERAAELRQIYKGRPDVHVAEVALSDTPGIASMWIASPRGWSGASTLSDEWARGCLGHWPNLPYEKRQVKVQTLAALLTEIHAPAGIGLLKLDVEGYELPALKGMDWNRRPGLVAVETMELGTVRHCAAISDYLAARGYVLVFKTQDNAVWERT